MPVPTRSARSARFASARSARLAGLSCAGLLAACNFEVPSSSYLIETKLITVLVEVVEFGPLNPDRVAVPLATAVVEPMPHDRVAFEGFVVEASGERVPTSELDSLWFQCGAFECGEALVDVSSALFERDCEDLEDDGLIWTMDAICRLGGGDGRFEFVVPELGQLLVEQRVTYYYGVFGWNGRSAASCWATRVSADASLDDCGFIQRTVRIGPSWWMLAYAETIGLQSPIPLEKIPGGVYFQQSNREPDPQVLVDIDGEYVGTWPQTQRFAVEAGDRVEIRAVYDETAQFLQTYFTVNLATYLFTANVEVVRDRPFTSNAMVWIEPDDPVTGTVTPDGRVTFVRERAGSWTQTYAGAVDATASPMTMSGLFNQDGGVVYVAWTAVFQVP